MEQLPAHHSNKQTIQKVELHYEKENMTTLKNNTVQRNENCSADCMCCSSFRKVIASTIQPDPQLRILKEVDRMFPFMIWKRQKKIGGRSFVRRTPTFYRKNEFSKIVIRRRIWWILLWGSKILKRIVLTSIFNLMFLQMPSHKNHYWRRRIQASNEYLRLCMCTATDETWKR